MIYLSKAGVSKAGDFRKLWPIAKFHDIIWVNYNDLTTTSLEIMVSKGNHPQMALIQII